MTFTAIEIIAIILIGVSIIKLAVLAASPGAWIAFARKIYLKPNVTSAVALVLAAVVLYYLVSSGMTIVQILAVWVFMALIMVVGFANYADDILDWAMGRDIKAWLREQWLLMVIWIGLLVWGIQAIFFSGPGSQ